MTDEERAVLKVAKRIARNARGGRNIMGEKLTFEVPLRDVVDLRAAVKGLRSLESERRKLGVKS